MKATNARAVAGLRREPPDASSATSTFTAATIQLSSVSRGEFFNGLLELQVPVLPPQAFGPGAVYDFHKALRDLLASATKSLFIVDPYLDDQVFDAYLSTVSQQVHVRLLARDYAASLKASVGKFIAQKKVKVEVRSSERIHDRVVLVDDGSCWVLGQLIKDAAKSKPTYLAPLATDAAQLRKADYEQNLGC
jgi:hypothetical protein